MTGPVSHDLIAGTMSAQFNRSDSTRKSMARVNAAATNLASEIAICDMPSTTLIVANVDQCSFEFLNLSNPTPQQQISTVSLQLACDYPTAVAS